MKEGCATSLFSPYALRGIELKNRIVLSPMCQYSAVDGMAQDWHVVHLGKFATGGFALVMTEATAVEARGRITHGDLGIWSDAHVAGLERIVDFIKSQGAAAGIQLAHAGRKGSSRRPWHGGAPLDQTDAAKGEPPWKPVAPSAAPNAAELSIAEVAEVIAAWRMAARRAKAAGFDLIEIHGAHGYLIHQFLSALSNQRGDRYGGSAENRMRLALEIVEAVQGEWGDRPLLFRMSVLDDADQSWSMAESFRLVEELKARGVGAVDCSSGGLATAGADIRGRYLPGYQVDLAAEVRKETGMPTVAVGLIVSAQGADRIIRDGQADLVAIGRQALLDPNWANRAALELTQAGFALWPPQYGWWLAQRQKRLGQSGQPNDPGR